MAHKLTVLFLFFATQCFLGQSIIVNDTDFSKGKLGHIQNVELTDVTKFHGHLCDGLVEGFRALELGLKQLFPNGIIDRTNTRIVSKSSPCLTDTAIYLSGGRSQYNTFYVDDTIEGLYIVQRIDNSKTILIKRKPNVKPVKIDELGNQAIKGELNECELEDLKKMEDTYSKFLKQSKAEDLFEINELSNFTWEPILATYTKTDILNKHQKPCRKTSSTNN